MLAWYHHLVAIRRAYPELTDGRTDQVDVNVDEEHGTLVVRRGRVRLAVATAAGPVALAVGAPDEPLAILLASGADTRVSRGTLSVRGPGAAVLACVERTP
jgi:maltooligosyltrehalose trehalohydrolase